MFFTLGPKQVGRAMISGWQELILPRVSQVKLWPFDGKIENLLRESGTTLVEIYPGEAYQHLGIPRTGWSKLKLEDRQSCSLALKAAAAAAGVSLAPDAAAAIDRGFAGDDDFDAMVGLISMLQVLAGARSSGEPDDRTVLEIEGWIFGQQSDEGQRSFLADGKPLKVESAEACAPHDLLERAIAIALRAHRGQTDKGQHAYIRHPLRVMELVSREGLEAMVAAVLHDVVEDSEMSFDDLRREGIPETVLHALSLVTKRPEEEGSETGYESFIRRIASSGSRLAIAVKLADVADNSDLSRLASPTPKDRNRAAKYERARRVLSEALG